MLDGLAGEHGQRLPFRVTTDMEDAVEGADFVFSAVRVGELEGRVVDETVPLSRGVLGQETTGPGGICFALRTIPVMVELAEVIARRAPRAWLINFTNPAGMVTEAVQQVLGDRAVGICDSPSGLCRRVAAALGRDAARAVVRLLRPQPPRLAARRARRRGRAAPGAARRRRAALTSFEEGSLFGAEWLRTLGMIPNEYLYYFYYASDTVDAIRESPTSRGAYLLEQQARFYAGNGEASADALAAWRATRHERERTYMAEARSAAGVGGAHEGGDEQADNGGYEGEAMAVVDAIANNTRTTLICNTANRSALPFLDAERGRRGARGRRARRARSRWRSARCPTTPQALVQSIKAVERATIEAALTRLAGAGGQGARPAPARASVTTAREIFDGVPAPAAGAGGALRMIDVAVATHAVPRHHVQRPRRAAAAGAGALRARAAPLAGRRRDHRGRRGPARPARRARRRRSAPTATGALLRDDARARGRRRWSRRTRARRRRPSCCPTNGDRAMVTYDPGARARRRTSPTLAPRALVLRARGAGARAARRPPST